MWFSTTSSIEFFQRRIKRCDQSCFEHRTLRDCRCGAKSTVQSISVVLGRRHRPLHVWTLLARWHNRKQEVHFVRVGSLLCPELLHHEGLATRSQVREEGRLHRIPHGKTTPKRCVKRNNTRTFTIDLSVIRGSEKPWSQKKCLKRKYKTIHHRFIRETYSNWVALKKWSARWTICEWRPPILPQKKNSTCIVAIDRYVRILWFRHDAHKASPPDFK